MSLADQQWCPTSVQVTVLQARGLRAKGKSGTNDAYAVMQVGKEKFQTSVVEKSVAPVWKEEAAFDLPQLHQGGGGGGGGGGTERCTLHVHVLHRALVGPDKLLGQAVVNLLQLSEDKTRNKTEWFKLLDKTGKADKDRGEVLVDIQFMRNNMTASMFDLSGAGKSRSRLGKFKDKVRGKKKESDTASTVVPSFAQVLTDSEEEGNGDGEAAAGKDEKKKKHKMKSLFSPKSNLQRNMSQSMSVLPAKNSSLSGSQSSGLNVDSSEGKKKFKFMIHKRSGSSDSKDSSSGRQKHGAAEQSNLCINGSHVYCEEPQPRTSRIGSNFSLASSGHGSMEDVPDSSPPSVDSLRAVRQYSPWTEEEEEEETAEVENIKEDVGDLRKGEEERIRMEEERARKEEERVRRQEEELERLAEEKRRREEGERRRAEEEKAKKEEEERIRREEEEERAQEERRRQEEEERVRREEEEERERLAEEKRRLEEQERMRIEEEKRQREEEERIRIKEEMAQEERKRLEEEESARRLEEERKLEEEKRRLVEERRIEEEKVKKEEEERIKREGERAEEERRRREEEELMKRQEEREEKRRLEEEERRQREELERIKREEERKQEEEEKAKREKEEYERLVEEKRKLEEEEERIRKEEEGRREEEEEERVRMEEERKRKEEEEHSIRMEEERKRKEEERVRMEEERRRKEEEEHRIRMEEERKRKEEERVRMEEERRRKEEEEEMVRRQEEERERLAEEKRRLEEQERRRIEEEEKRQMEEEERIRKEEERRQEEEDRARKEKEEMERLAEERRRLEEQERMRIEEEERIRKEEKAEKERKEEEARKLEKEKLTGNAEEQKKRENTANPKSARMKSKMAVESPAEVTATNPFDENYSNNPFEENSPAGPDGSTARCQSAVSSLGSKTAFADEKDPISSQRERRPAPQPPGRNQAERQSQREQDGSTRHLAQINKQGKDKDAKTISVLPQRSVQMITPLSRSPADSKNGQSLEQSSATKVTANSAKPSKRPAPSRPRSVEEGPSSGPKTASSSDGNTSHESGSNAKQEPVVYGLNPFEDDEDENELTAQDDTTSGSTGSTQWPPAVPQAADREGASQKKIKSSKMAPAPPLPAKKAATSSTLISQNTEGGHVTDDTDVPEHNITHSSDPESEATSPVQSPLQEPQPAAVQSAGEEAGGKKEGPPTTSRRLQPVRPLNPLEQQSVSVIQGEKDKKSTGILCEVQEKTKVNDTGLKGPYSQLTQEELISLVLKQGNQLSERDKKISELEQYIDNLLVRVIEEKPSILMSLNSLKKAV